MQEPKPSDPSNPFAQALAMEEGEGGEYPEPQQSQSSNPFAEAAAMNEEAYNSTDEEGGEQGGGGSGE